MGKTLTDSTVRQTFEPRCCVAEYTMGLSMHIGQGSDTARNGNALPASQHSLSALASLVDWSGEKVAWIAGETTFGFIWVVNWLNAANDGGAQIGHDPPNNAVAAWFPLKQYESILAACALSRSALRATDIEN